MLILLAMKTVPTFNFHFSHSQAFQIPSGFQYEFLKPYNVKPITIMIFALTPPAFVNKITLSCQKFIHLEMLLPVLRRSRSHSRHTATSRVFEGNSLSFQ